LRNTGGKRKFGFRRNFENNNSRTTNSTVSGLATATTATTSVYRSGCAIPNRPIAATANTARATAGSTATATATSARDR
jgi:hypothetical protein